MTWIALEALCLIALAMASGVATVARRRRLPWIPRLAPDDRKASPRALPAPTAASPRADPMGQRGYIRNARIISPEEVRLHEAADRYRMEREAAARNNPPPGVIVRHEPGGGIHIIDNRGVTFHDEPI